VALNSEKVKNAILDLLEKDREFRYALMGLLGFKEILDRITRLEERQQRLEERQQRLEERFAELERHFARLEERQQKLEERFAKLEERVARLEVALENLNRTVAVIAHRFGILSESGLREAMKHVVEDFLGVAKVERLIVRDDEGVVYGHPAEVEVDVVIKDDSHMLIEIKSRVSRSDVLEIYRIGILYEKKYGIKPKLLIIGGFVDPNAWETASRLKVEIKPAIPNSNIVIP